MNILIFGASGMVGQAVLREGLKDACTQHVLAVGRSALQVQHPKLAQVVCENLFELELDLDQAQL